MKIKRMALAELTPADYNPRTISAAARKGLEHSIERFGMVQPIIYNSRTGNVVGGHRRLDILLDRGDTHSQIVVVDLPEDEEKALNLALNNPGIAGQFTADVAEIIQQLEHNLPDFVAELRLGEIDFPTEPTDIAAEYQGMPEFENQDLSAYRQIVVSFHNDKDARDFGKLIGQPVTQKTRALWYPAEEREAVAHIRFVDDNT